MCKLIVYCSPLSRTPTHAHPLITHLTHHFHRYTRKERTGARPEEMEFGETDIFEEPELSEIFDDDETLEDILNEGFGHVDEDEGEGEGAKMKEKEKAKVKAEAKAKTKVKEEVELGGGWVVGEDEDIIEL